jgi:hypothetical protein
LRSRRSASARPAPVQPGLQHLQPLQLEPARQQPGELGRARLLEAGNFPFGRVPTLPLRLEVDGERPGAGEVDRCLDLALELGVELRDLLADPVEVGVERGQRAPLALDLERRKASEHRQ